MLAAQWALRAVPSREVSPAEAAAAELEAHGLRLHSVMTLEDMLRYLVQRGTISEDLATEVFNYLGI